MRRKSNSGFYLSRKAAAFFGLLIVLLLLGLTVLAILYGKLRAERAHYFSMSWGAPSTDWEPLAPGRRGPWNNSRLPNSLIPIHYQLELWPRLVPGQKQLGEFWGQVNVTVRCEEETGIVLLHSQQLRYSGLAVRAGGTEPRSSPAIRDTWLEVQNDYLVIELNDTLVPGQDYIIQANCSGQLEEKLTGLFVVYYQEWGINKLECLCLNDEVEQIKLMTINKFDKPIPPLFLHGTANYSVLKPLQLSFVSQKKLPLFSSNYFDYNDRKLKNFRTIITSQMEPTFARSVFPCFDEPAMKATFDIRLVHHPQFVAVSNMPIIDFSERLEEDGIWKVTTFNTTMKMSTYLVAFMVSDYGYINTTYNSVEIRVWADKEALSSGDFEYVLNITGPTLGFFEEYFNISYPLSKLDIIAVPQFEESAMENWGMLVFQKDLLRSHPKKSTPEAKIIVSILVAHELAHQWFGNLATMNWWNDLWLNEGFATYFEFIGASLVNPLDDVQFNARVYKMLHGHEYFHSQSLIEKEEYVRTFEEIRQMFNGITYSKGAIIIHMACHFMTHELLQKGIRSYLKAFSYSNAVTDDIWNHLQMAIDSQDAIKLPAPVKSIMDTWTMQKGLPFITVNTTSGVIKQENYLEKELVNKTSNSSWFVPIFWLKNGSTQPLVWLKEKYAKIPEVKCTTDEEWVLVNTNISALYRVNYDNSNWRRLALQLNKNPSVIPDINRAQIIGDAFDFAWSGYSDIENALEITMYLAKEQTNIVWLTALHHLQQLEVVVMTTSIYGLYKKYIFKQIAPFYYYQMKLINNDFNNTHTDAVMISLLTSTLNMMCRHDQKECLDHASSLFSQLMSDPTNNIIPDPLREAVYCGALIAGSDKEWDFAFSLYQKYSSVLEEENDVYILLKAMVCCTEPWILKRYLYYAMDESKISRNHALLVFNYIANNPIGWLLVWNFIRGNWETFQTLSTDYLYRKYLFTTLIDGFSADFEFKEFELFLNSTCTTDDGEWSTIVQEINSLSQKKQKWKKNYYPKIHKWLIKNVHAD